MSHYAISLEGVDRAGWLDRRKQFIGGSDASAVMGLSSWTSPYALALDKLGVVADHPAGEAAEWGTRLEGVVAEYAVEQLNAIEVAAGREPGWTLDRSTKDEMYVSDTFPWAAVNLDGIIVSPKGERFGYEGKTASEYKLDEWGDRELTQVPIGYQLQVQHAMAVREDLPKFLVAALVGGNKFKMVWVDRNDVAIARLMADEKLFWAMVQRGEVPAPSGSDQDKALLIELHPDAAGEVELDGEALKLAESYKEAASEEKAAKVVKDECSNRLRILLGDAKKAHVGTYVINRVQSEVPEHMVKASTRDYLTVK